MEIPIKDKSNYLKGLLIVAKKDKQLADSEKRIIRGIGEKLGFASDFYEDVLKDLLSNEYILEDPIKFSNIKIAKSFIDDGLKLAYSDNKMSDDIWRIDLQGKKEPHRIGFSSRNDLNPQIFFSFPLAGPNRVLT